MAVPPLATLNQFTVDEAFNKMDPEPQRVPPVSVGAAGVWLITACTGIL
jgi:hypothetical protein